MLSAAAKADRYTHVGKPLSAGRLIVANEKVLPKIPSGTIMGMTIRCSSKPGVSISKAKAFQEWFDSCVPFSIRVVLWDVWSVKSCSFVTDTGGVHCRER